MEVLFARHLMGSDGSGTYMEHYIRAKVYTRKGIERLSLLSFDHERRSKIWGLVARVVKADGASHELSKADFHESVAVKTRGFEMIRTSFAFPNVEPGDVLEYRWIADLPDSYGYYIQYCQMENVPTREFVFETKGAQSDYTVSWFNCTPDPKEAKKQKLVFHNLPPFVSEPFMPTDTEFRSWIVVQFTSAFQRYYSNKSAWNEIGNYLGEDFRLLVKPNQKVNEQAANLIRGLATDDEKLTALYDFSQTAIANLDSSDDPTLDKAKKHREDQPRPQTPAKTLDLKSGNTEDINRLFAGLAIASGFQARLALSADRSRILRIDVPNGWYFADRQSIAVKTGQGWKFFTPGDHLVPAGMLDTEDEGAAVFVCDEKKSWFDHAQTALPAQTRTTRTGRFTLDAEGTLDGDVAIQRTGHRAIRTRRNWWDTSADDAAKSVREQLIERLPTTEVSNMWLEALRDPSQPFTLHYHVHVPGYAEAIGSRLGLPLNFFEANATALFSNEIRRYPIFFDFAEEVHDDIEITLPAGLMLDGASAPAPVTESVIHVNYQVSYAPKSHLLAYRRDYVLGEQGAIAFRQASYPALRKLFDHILASDTHQLVLKPKPAPAPVPVVTEATPAL